MQVLRNDGLRESYDRYLDQRRMLGLISPSEIIGRQDLHHTAEDGVMAYDCRCGGSYVVDVADLQLYTETLLPCDTCSQYICLDTSHEQPPSMPAEGDVRVR